VAFQVAAFEFDDQFDASWHTGTGGGGPTPPAAPNPPSGVRVLSSGAGMLLPLGALVGWRRRAAGDPCV
jgi:hypothetical protein